MDLKRRWIRLKNDHERVRTDLENNIEHLQRLREECIYSSGQCRNPGSEKNELQKSEDKGT